MTQAYFSATGRTVSSPLPMMETPSTDSASQEKHLNAEDVQEAYITQKDSLVEALDSTKSILGDLRAFNKESWVVRYPQFHEEKQNGEVKKRRGGMRRSLSFADEPALETEVVLGKRGELKRAATIAEEVQDATEEPSADPTTDSEFHVLRLDLKLGPHGSSSSPASLVSQLEKSSIANLLDERILSSLAHIDKLQLRVQDTSSKVLVTGDLNAGKSTFVNALLRREVMPVDQQPCTTAFCEVHDASENGGKEEVHVLKEGAHYDPKDESTFTRVSLDGLEGIVSENENSQQVLKMYLADSRQPDNSLLNNGVVDISLIDAPGLNRDSLKTTALFSRQEEIDVVVFVVSAENHFTLSAKEFLWNASNEKAYVFIVVNKFEGIKNKDKCRRLVLEQIKQLSPRTYEDAEDLVHFVDSAAALDGTSEQPSFENLESSLRSFVLVKRAKSKLAPVSNYLLNLLKDVSLLVGSNAIVAESELERAKADLDRTRPVWEKMKNSREVLEDTLEHVEEEGASKANTTTRQMLSTALDRVGEGLPGVERPMVEMPSYPGLLGIWDYAKDVRRALLASLDLAVKLAEDEARVITSAGVKKVSDLGDEHLPEGVERSRRVFIPEAMFSARRSTKKGRRSSGVVVAGGTQGLGLGLAQRPELLETSFLDLFDVYHQFSVHFGEGKEGKEEEEMSPTALSVVSVGVGALTVVGGKTLGVRSLIEGIARVSDVLSNETARKWAAPVIGAVAIGATAYFILELPSTIPRTVGRRIRSSLVKQEGSQDDMFVDAHATRISRETRKVLRLASWDLRERFRTAMDERGKEVKGAEEMEKQARKALEYFLELNQRTGEVKEKVQSTVVL
ncbi:hypothetical protein GLOTRDRAFT_77565 [Gloeophyllum trabeum ATCC 11539]|uniref:Dynamin-type G domain-containing protein n=1 Tax=Gloeophyllum trabeum (strain ATCC 11539 / FP-39264 / Madison 617) TaxID=670483 RepID=S7Q461_GLOTA|nr:uncharacterized protein GLOTRDRAFT_77565 [Gloeophyllum trabeum ATCC 11539]EPQ54806.1 hypothetical protein GLOTRDRAFT_77565 [Gloeophyllum trabeum ATCC 11539]